MWTVICFEMDNTVDAVPDFWYKKGVCAWPKKSVNCRKFIDQRVKPNKDDFYFYKARPLSQNIGKNCIPIN